ncbi:MAG: T9SS type A sorting domain-containing protein [Bacteroidales bacterium]|nr:T9SS type A sorting domain-containing protein [Bacteroidales bacterium]
MKKLSLLLLLAVFAFCGLNAQTVVLSEDFSAITDSSSSTITNHLDDYTQVPGWVGDWVYPSNGKVKVGKSSAAGFIQTPALDLSDNNGQFVVTFDAKAWNGDATSLFLEVNDIPYTVEGLSTSAFQTFSVPLSGGTSATTIKFQGFQDNRGRFFLDNVLITSQPMGPDTIGPFVANVNPSENSLAVIFNEILDQSTAQNVTNYSINNGISVTAATLNGSVVTLTVSPALTEGSDYTLIVHNVADANGNMMTPDTVTFTYGVSSEFQVANIAELRSKLDYTDVSVNNSSNVEYKLTGEVVVTATASYNNQKVLQDASGAVLVYDPENKLGALEVGDKVKDLYGTLTNYYGFLEFKPTQPYGSLVSIYQDVTPLTITLPQLNDQNFMIQHQAELIRLNNVTFNTPGSFAVLNTYEITQDGVTASAVYPYFQDANTVGADIPTGTVNITGFNFSTSKIGSTYLDYRYYIVPRSMNDFTTGLPQYLTENDIVIYPNPVADQLTVSLRTNNFQVTSMSVFDINGKLINTQAVSDNQIEMNTQSLAAGSYFLRLSDGKNCVTTKFVKK